MPRLTQEQWIAKYEEMSIYEKEARQQGFTAIAGVDEAGRGPLAGPVVAAAVILDPEKPVYGVNDSKKLSPVARARLLPIIEQQAIAFGIGIVDEKEIDRINILEATKVAMEKALLALQVPADYVLLDALTLPGLIVPQMGIIKGDAKSVSIAAASILAKETRDQIMRAYDEVYPEYGFASHKGYGTKEHMDKIREFGPSPIHRRTFIKKLLEEIG